MRIGTVNKERSAGPTRTVWRLRMRVRHIVIFTFYETTTEAQIAEVITRLNATGKYLEHEVGVTDWLVAKHLPER